MTFFRWFGSIALVGTISSFAQTTSSSSAYVPTLNFDVVSVRQSHPDPSGFMVGGDNKPAECVLRIQNFDPPNLLYLAFGGQRWQYVNLPKWPDRPMFNVEAKCDAATVAKLATLTKEQQRLEQEHMMQAVMADRFKLKAHWETRDADGYELIATKPGLMKQSSGAPPTAAEVDWFRGHPIPPLYQKNDGKGYDFIAHGASTADIVTMLTGQMGRPVNDKTGLIGKYDFVLKYRGRTDRDRAADDMDEMLPMDQAIQQELGLKLVPTKVQAQYLVIDHIEMPSEN